MHRISLRASGGSLGAPSATSPIDWFRAHRPASRYRRSVVRALAIALAAGATLPHAALAQNEANRIHAGTFKVGDRISADPIGISKWDTCTILSARPMPYDASKVDAFQIRCDHNAWSDVIATTDRVRTTSEANVVESGASRAQPPAGANKYGTRDPRTCADTRAPSSGAISAAQATQYFICQAEQVSGQYLYLVENVSVEVGGPARYDPRTQTGFSNMDTRVPIYPIRGSFLEYQCSEVDAKFDSRYNNFRKNCNTYLNRKATGYCYKTTFGDWNCTMNDVMKAQDDKHFQVAPPM